MANYDIVGSIAILKTEGFSKREVQKAVKELLSRPNIKTVVEKTERFKGRLRTLKVKHLAGSKELETEYKESGCRFRVNVEKCYFSSRLSNERLEVAKKVKKGDDVLVMFSGVAPFPIVIAKHSKPKSITAIELGRECNKMARANVRVNKMESDIKLIQGDVKRVIARLRKKFDLIIMPRPNLKDLFLKEAFKVSKKGTRIIYYGFSHRDKLGEMIEGIKKEAEKNKKKIKIMRKKEAGDIAPFKFRYRIEMKVV